MERPLKQRLVGAAVLVAVVVLVLPELLSGRREVVTLEPTRDDSGVPLRAHEFALGETPTAEEQAVAADELQPDPETAPPEAVAQTPEGPQSQPGAQPQAQPPAPPSGIPAVPVQAPAAVVAAAPAAMPPAKPGAVSPPATMPATVPAAAPAKAPAAAPPADKPAPKAAPKPAAAANAAPAAKAPVTLSAWVVQIGSFGTRQKAEELVAKLQAKGFRAFTLPYTSGGRTLHRVRVGPEQSRKMADEIAKRLEADGYQPHVTPQE